MSRKQRMGLVTEVPVNFNMGEMMINAETIAGSVVSSLSVDQVAAFVKRIDVRMGDWAFTREMLDFYLAELKNGCGEFDDVEDLRKYQMLLAEALGQVEYEMEELRKREEG